MIVKAANRLRRALLACLLAVCSGGAPGQAPDPAPPGADKPAVGAFGLDLAGMDPTVAPGDSFYDYINGRWQRETPIPPDKSGYSVFNQLDDLSRARTRAILEQAAADPGSKIGIAYTSFLDTRTIEAKGVAPLRPWLGRIAGLRTRAGYAALAAAAARNGIETPFVTGVEQDARRPSVYAVELAQDGLGLPDRDYYRKPAFAPQKAAYQAHLARMLALAGESDAEPRAKAILRFEDAIAAVSWSRADSRDATRTYNRMTIAALARRAPGFDFASFLSHMGRASPAVIVAQPSAVAGIARRIAATPLQVLRDQLLVRSLDHYAAVLPSAFDEAHFAFYGHTLSGTPEQRARWKRAADFATDALADDISRIYVARYFPPATKAAADRLVANLIAAMNARIDRLDWMSAQTRARAHAKLAAFTPEIGYPGRWHDYSALAIVKGDALGNRMRADQWQFDDETSRLGQPIRRWEWGMTPMTVNAYAYPPLVEIVFPASILQPPFFDPHADPAVNYGAIGAIIGHEMSHHFDDQGAKYDAKGRLANWWTPNDMQKFNALEDKLVAQYDAYEPIAGMHVNGRLTLGENSADLAGLSAAYDAYHAALQGRPAPVIDGLSGDQRFFMAWAQAWRGKFRLEARKQRLVTDPHAPPEQRADIVRNMDAWVAAFHPAPTAKLYLPPDQRVRIW
ncbi:MAG: M13 family metallopeptidase [Sphingomonadales bacterium]|nr:M13 family metallopeptidase [Sphingomonadales bacterium]